jgi:hypothetical protein
MSCAIASGRFTSKDVVIEYLPCGEAATHVQKLFFPTSVSAGTFKLRVNGKETAAITYSDTVATLITNINAQLDLVTDAAADLVASGAASTEITITAAANGWYTIAITDDSLTGNTSSDPSISTLVVTQGSKVYRISGELSSFGYEVSVDLVDVTGLSEYEGTEIPVKETMSFDISIYKSATDWEHAVKAGKSGTITVYEQGKVAGQRYFAFRGLFDKASLEFPDHEVVEGEMSGVRQGAMITDFNSIYAG